jgi:hypothetical protein
MLANGIDVAFIILAFKKSSFSSIPHEMRLKSRVIESRKTPMNAIGIAKTSHPTFSPYLYLHPTLTINRGRFVW